MHWLQSLDTGLFYFINHSLSNPLFDWLMPVLSGGNGVMRYFVPLAVFAALAAIVFGNTRARLCALMIVLVVGLGDPLIINTIKHLIARPRPCIALADAIARVGRTTSGSMPSAHAANWFAAAMIVFLFNRKKYWLTVPVLIMALAVSFSRVYNGVHYPSDVLAGAILGSGYAVAFAVTVQALWNVIGKKWFPAWHERLPSLLNPVPKEPQACAVKTEWLRLGYFLIFAMLIGRWIYLASGAIELSQDEAYQWVWSKHLALSYYSKPPGIAFIQFASTSLFGDTGFGVRFFSPLFAAILGLIVFRFFAREVNARAAFWLLLAASSVPLLGIGSVLMTVDAPLVLCWSWAMLAGWRALQPDGKTGNWVMVGLATGLAFLCKYSAIYLVICFGIFFLFHAPSRIHLRKPGPWLALLTFVLCTLPVLIWNSQHHWITVTHVAGNAGLGSHWHPTLRYFIDFVGSELALLNPVFLTAAIWAAIGGWKSRQPLWLYFFCMSVPVLAGHLIWSFHSRIQPNWIAPAIIPLFCLMAIYWDGRWRVGARLPKIALATGLMIGFFAVAIMYQTDLVRKLTGQLLPGEKDPSRRIRAWKQAAAAAEDEREKLATNGSSAFIICSHYGDAGLFSFYLPNAKSALKSEPLVYSVDSTEPQNQFYFWPEYNYHTARQGQNAVFVSQIDPYPLEKGWVWKWLAGEPIGYKSVPPPETILPEIAGDFQSVTDLGEREIKIGDRVFHREHLWACYDLK
ncbi:MAG TPA: glycosyltransferase family 39 protein [Verrucomicrobiae bacterium]|jgi:membrane-associated phospholipid phosphatase